MTQVFRLLADPVFASATANSGLYAVPKKGDLVFLPTGRKTLSTHPKGWGLSFPMPDDAVEPYSFSDVRASDFEALVRYYSEGCAALPNFEQISVERGLNAIASGSGMKVSGVQNVLLPGAERTTWARLFLTMTQGGKLDGRGYVVWYKSPWVSSRGEPEGSQIGTFAICKHENVPGAGANPQRGWHPGSCLKCGLDMTVDSGD
jgi:hypothetical protein